MAAEGVEYEQVIYEMPAPKVARIVMNRPSRRNAQGITMTYELDDAFKRACHDEQINVIILAASGDHWNSGHDVSGEGPRNPSLEQVTGLWSDYGGKGWDGPYGREREIYLEITERWRNAPKPVIAEIQGSALASRAAISEPLSASRRWARQRSSRSPFWRWRAPASVLRRRMAGSSTIPSGKSGRGGWRRCPRAMTRSRSRFPN